MNPKGELGSRLAGVLYDGEYVRDKCETVLHFALSKAFRDHGGDDEKVPEIKRLDYYDQSIEWWAEPGAVLDEIDCAVLGVLGFYRAWVCYRGVPSDKPREQRETYYYFGPAHKAAANA